MEGGLPLHHASHGPQCEVADAPHRQGLSGGQSDLALRSGEVFSVAARRLAGLAGIVFGWTPDVFWNATPAELAALVEVGRGDEPVVADAGDLARLMEVFPDG